jgi:hypothetical protein
LISLFINSFHYVFGTKSRSVTRAKPRSVPRAMPRSVPRAMPRSVPRAMPRGGGINIGVLVSASLDEQFMDEAENCTPSEVEGWRYKHWSSRLGFARRTDYGRSRELYPERSRGVGWITSTSLPPPRVSVYRFHSHNLQVDS